MISTPSNFGEQRKDLGVHLQCSQSKRERLPWVEGIKVEVGSLLQEAGMREGREAHIFRADQRNEHGK